MNPTSILSILAAEATNNCVSTALFGEVCDNCNGSATMQILSYVVRAMTYGVGILAVIGIMVFGIRYLTSRDDESLAIKARRHLFQVLIGIASYIVLVLTASWILPGNLTTTMLGGSPATCPEASKTEITVIEPTPQDQSNPNDPSASTPLSEGWKSGTRPRECGPGTPGDFQTMTKQKDKDGKNVNVYTTSQGRTYFLFSQGDSRWGSYTGWSCCGSTLKDAGCYETSMAMVMNSYSFSANYTPRYYSTSEDKVAVEKIRISSEPKEGIQNRIIKIIDSGGAIVTHINYSGGGTHWFVIADYRIKNGDLEYYVIDTHGDSDLDWRKPSSVDNKMCGISIKNCNGGYTGILEYRPTKELDCKIR